MKMTKRIALFLALLLALTALSACKGNDDKKENGNSALDQVQNGTHGGQTEESTPPVSDTEADTTEADTTEPPAEETTEEITDEITEPLPSHGNLKLPCDGTLTSKESKYLYLSAYYAVSENSDGTLNVTVDVTLTGYEMYVGARYSGCTLTVGDQSVSFTTAAISCTDRNKQTVIPFIAESFVLPADTTEIPIKVTWPFNGNYGAVDLKDLVIDEIIK